ncbi:MAG: cyclic-di-AMP receptor [Clostridiales bacterium]|nr:cyclic-di-AMP receptor [Clostridiales bacterium]
MKLIFAIISNKDVEKVLAALSESGFRSTRISTMGQFLENGHSCIIVGDEEKHVDSILSIIENNVTKRVVRSYGVSSTLAGSLLKQPVDVEENGGIAVVIDVEQYKRF